MVANVTFTVRVSAATHVQLELLAEILGESVASISRDIFHEGIRLLLDPVEIERQYTTQRDKLLAAAAQIREDGKTQ